MPLPLEWLPWMIRLMSRLSRPLRRVPKKPKTTQRMPRMKLLPRVRLPTIRAKLPRRSLLRLLRISRIELMTVFLESLLDLLTRRAKSSRDLMLTGTTEILKNGKRSKRDKDLLMLVSSFPTSQISARRIRRESSPSPSCLMMRDLLWRCKPK